MVAYALRPNRPFLCLQAYQHSEKLGNIRVFSYHRKILNSTLASMKLYFSTKQIPQLQSLSLTQRIKLLETATTQLTIPEKTLLNVLKLCVIAPFFILLLRVVNDWTSLLWACLILLLYPLVVRPIQFSMSAKYLPEVKQSQD